MNLHKIISILSLVLVSLLPNNAFSMDMINDSGYRVVYCALKRVWNSPFKNYSFDKFLTESKELLGKNNEDSSSLKSDDVTKLCKEFGIFAFSDVVILEEKDLKNLKSSDAVGCNREIKNFRQPSGKKFAVIFYSKKRWFFYEFSKLYPEGTNRRFPGKASPYSLAVKDLITLNEVNNCSKNLKNYILHDELGTEEDAFYNSRAVAKKLMKKYCHVGLTSYWFDFTDLKALNPLERKFINDFLPKEDSVFYTTMPPLKLLSENDNPVQQRIVDLLPTEEVASLATVLPLENLNNKDSENNIEKSVLTEYVISDECGFPCVSDLDLDLGLDNEDFENNIEKSVLTEHVISDECAFPCDLDLDLDLGLNSEKIDVSEEKLIHENIVDSADEALAFCQICSGFFNSRELSAHIKNKHEVVFSCIYPGCKKDKDQVPEFKLYSELLAHIDATHLNSLKCDFCDKTLKNKYSLKTHILSFCRKSGFSFERCFLDQCSSQTTAAISYSSTHVQEKHKKYLNGEEFSCKKCAKKGLGFTVNAKNLPLINEHMKRIHYSLLPINTFKGNNWCTDNHILAVNTNEITISDERCDGPQYLCLYEKCKEENQGEYPLFRGYSNLNCHIQEKHLKKVQCDFCLKSFESNIYALKEHILSACKQAGYLFDNCYLGRCSELNNKNLPGNIRHVYENHATYVKKKTGEFSCKECLFEVSAEELPIINRHMRCKHSNGVRNFARVLSDDRTREALFISKKIPNQFWWWKSEKFGNIDADKSFIDNGDTSLDSLMHKCPFPLCVESFLHYEDFIKHLRDEAQNSFKEGIGCKVCNNQHSFSNSKHLLKHLLRSCSRNSFIMTECFLTQDCSKKCLGAKAEASGHIKNHHQDCLDSDGNFKCPRQGCDFSIDPSELYKIHYHMEKTHGRPLS